MKNDLLEGVKERLIFNEMVFANGSHVCGLSFILNKGYEDYIKEGSVRPFFYTYIDKKFVIENGLIKNKLEEDEDYNFEMKFEKDNVEINLQFESYQNLLSINCLYNMGDKSSTQKAYISKTDPYRPVSDRITNIKTSNKYETVFNRFHRSDPVHDYYYHEGEPIDVETISASTNDKIELEDQKDYYVLVLFPCTKGTPIVRIFESVKDYTMNLNIYTEEALFSNVSSKRTISTERKIMSNFYKNIAPLSPMSKYKYLEDTIGEELVETDNDGEVVKYISPMGIAKINGNRFAMTDNPGSNLPLDEEVLEKFDKDLSEFGSLTKCDDIDVKKIECEYSEMLDKEFIDMMIDTDKLGVSAKNIIEHMIFFKYDKGRVTTTMKTGLVTTKNHIIIKFYLYDQYIYANIWIGKSTDVDSVKRKVLYSRKQGIILFNTTEVISNEESGRYCRSRTTDLARSRTNIEQILYAKSGDPLNVPGYRLTYNDSTVFFDCASSDDVESNLSFLNFQSLIFTKETGIYIRDEFGIPYKYYKDKQ